MAMMIKVVLGAFYFLFLVGARVVTALLGRDPLGRQRKIQGGTYWLVRNASPDMESYFSQGSVEEVKPPHRRPVAGTLMPVVLLLARLSAPPEMRKRRVISRARRQEEGIADEIYTLW